MTTTFTIDSKNILSEKDELKVSINRSFRYYQNNIAVFYGNEYYTYRRLATEVSELGEWLSGINKEIPVMIKSSEKPIHIALMVAVVNQGLVIVPYSGLQQSESVEAFKGHRELYYITENEWFNNQRGVHFVSEFKSLKLFRINGNNNIQGSGDFKPGRYLSDKRNYRPVLFEEDTFTSASNFWNSKTNTDDVFYCMDIYNNWLTFYFSILPVLLSGATLVIHAGDDTPLNIVNRCRKHSASVLIASLDVYEMILAEEYFDYNFSGIRIAVSNYSPFFNEISLAWKRRFGKQLSKLCLPEESSFYFGNILIE